MAWEHANGVPLKPLTKQESRKEEEKRDVDIINAISVELNLSSEAFADFSFSGLSEEQVFKKMMEGMRDLPSVSTTSVRQSDSFVEFVDDDGDTVRFVLVDSIMTKYVNGRKSRKVTSLVYTPTTGRLDDQEAYGGVIPSSDRQRVLSVLKNFALKSNVQITDFPPASASVSATKPRRPPKPVGSNDASTSSILQLQRIYHSQVSQYAVDIRESLHRQRQARGAWTDQIESLMVQFMDHHARKLGIKLLDLNLEWDQENPLVALVQKDVNLSIFTEEFQPLKQVFIDSRAHKKKSPSSLLVFQPEFLMRYIVELNRNCAALSLLLSCDKSHSKNSQVNSSMQSETLRYGDDTSSFNVETIAKSMSSSRHLFLSDTMFPTWKHGLDTFEKTTKCIAG